MELVSKGIEANNADAPCCLTQPPPKRLLLPKTAIDEKSQDSILRHVGDLPQHSVHNMERSGRDADVKQRGCMGYQPLREVRGKPLSGEVKYQRGPCHTCQPQRDSIFQAIQITSQDFAS